MTIFLKRGSLKSILMKKTPVVGMIWSNIYRKILISELEVHIKKIELILMILHDFYPELKPEKITYI